ncbi:MAG TPA: hypothetical protein VLZ50_09915 [Terracidiphilus sp.]|nr:hypothetical protein [Terracidiphilus sp.]
MKLREMAHARAGDKGSIVNISLIAFDVADYPLLAEHVTAEKVSALFAPILARPVERYTIPGLGALNFVLHRTPAETVTRSLHLDAHGKGLSYVLLNMEVDIEGDRRIG